MVASRLPARATREALLAVLDGVMDPEVPVLSVRELGIVRDLEIDDAGAVTVTVTPTYSGCPAIQVIEQDIVAALEQHGVSSVVVRTTYAPAWTTDWIAPAARAKLKAYGIAPPGRAESGGALLFMAGKKGKRFILPNAKVMIHQPFGGVYGQAADIEIQAEEILKTKDTLVNVMAKCTGQTPEKVREDSERDRFFDAKQAVAYGICDEVLEDAASAEAIAATDGNKPK